MLKLRREGWTFITMVFEMAHHNEKGIEIPTEY